MCLINIYKAGTFVAHIRPVEMNSLRSYVLLSIMGVRWLWNAGVNYSSQLCSVRLQGLLVCYVCSDQLDAIAQKKLVNFVHDLMTQYFDFVCRRVQLEVITIS